MKLPLIATLILVAFVAALLQADGALLPLLADLRAIAGEGL